MKPVPSDGFRPSQGGGQPAPSGFRCGDDRDFNPPAIEDQHLEVIAPPWAAS